MTARGGREVLFFSHHQTEKENKHVNSKRDSRVRGGEGIELLLVPHIIYQ
jgi:hypothetical protein